MQSAVSAIQQSTPIAFTSAQQSLGFERKAAATNSVSFHLQFGKFQIADMIIVTNSY